MNNTLFTLIILGVVCLTTVIVSLIWIWLLKMCANENEKENEKENDGYMEQIIKDLHRREMEDKQNG